MAHFLTFAHHSFLYESFHKLTEDYALNAAFKMPTETLFIEMFHLNLNHVLFLLLLTCSASVALREQVEV